MVNKDEFVITLIIFAGVVLLFLLGTLLYFGLQDNEEKQDFIGEINSFEECVSAGYDIMESYPRRCRIPDGDIFVERMQGKGIEIIKRLSPLPRGDRISDDFYDRGFLIQSEEEWAEVFSGESGVDFNKYSVLAEFVGQRNTGGYSVEILEVTESDNSINLFVKEMIPGENCMVTQVISYPFDVIVIPKTDKTLVEVEYRQEVYDC